MSASQTIALTRAIERLPPVVAPEATVRYLRLFEECALGNVTCDAKDPNEALRLFQRRIVSEGPVESEKWMAAARHIFPLTTSSNTIRRICEATKIFETMYWAARLECYDMENTAETFRQSEEEHSTWRRFGRIIDSIMRDPRHKTLRDQLPDELHESLFRMIDIEQLGMSSIAENSSKGHIKTIKAYRCVAKKHHRFMRDALDECKKWMRSAGAREHSADREYAPFEQILRDGEVVLTGLKQATLIDDERDTTSIAHTHTWLLPDIDKKHPDQMLIAKHFAPYLTQIYTEIMYTNLHRTSPQHWYDQFEQIREEYQRNTKHSAVNNAIIRIAPDIMSNMENVYHRCRQKQRNSATWARELISFHNCLLTKICNERDLKRPVLFACELTSAKGTDTPPPPSIDAKPPRKPKRKKHASSKNKRPTKKKALAPIHTAAPSPEAKPSEQSRTIHQEHPEPTHAGAGAPDSTISPQPQYAELTWEMLQRLSEPPPILDKAHRVLQWETNPEAKFTHPDSPWYGCEGHTRIMQEVYHHFPDELFQLLNTPYALLGEEEHHRSFTGSDPYYLYDDVYYLYAQVCVALSPDAMINETGIIKIITARQTKKTFHVYLHECTSRDEWVRERMQKSFPQQNSRNDSRDDVETGEASEKSKNTADRVIIHSPNQVLSMHYYIQDRPVTLKLYPDFKKLLELDF